MNKNMHTKNTVAAIVGGAWRVVRSVGEDIRWRSLSADAKRLELRAMVQEELAKLRREASA